MAEFQAAKEDKVDDDPHARLNRWAAACEEFQRLEDAAYDERKERLEREAAEAKAASDAALEAAYKRKRQAEIAKQKDAAAAKEAVEAARKAAKAREALAEREARQARRAAAEARRRDREDALAVGAVGMLYAHDADHEGEAIEVDVPETATLGEVLALDFYGEVWAFRAERPGVCFLRPPRALPSGGATPGSTLVLDVPESAKPGDTLAVTHKGQTYHVDVPEDYAGGSLTCSLVPDPAGAAPAPGE